jgi:hypothetical protein
MEIPEWEKRGGGSAEPEQTVVFLNHYRPGVKDPLAFLK